MSEVDWVTPGAEAYMLDSYTRSATRVTIERLTATQVVCTKDGSGRERRFRIDTLALIGSGGGHYCSLRPSNDLDVLRCIRSRRIIVVADEIERAARSIVRSWAPTADMADEDISRSLDSMERGVSELRKIIGGCNG